MRLFSPGLTQMRIPPKDINPLLKLQSEEQLRVIKENKLIYYFMVFVEQDVWQYFTNLTQANLMNKPEWLIEYKATEAFNIPDVSPQSLHSLVQKFESQDSAYFEKYFLYNSVSAGAEICDEQCKTAQICGITKVDFGEYDDCLKSTDAPNRQSTIIIVFGLFLIMSLLLE